jgi:hypothetical protein
MRDQQHHNYSQATVSVVAVGILMVWTAAVSANDQYRTISVVDGGTLTGQVTMKGEPPSPRLFPAALYPFGPFCTKNTAILDEKGHFRLPEFRVGTGGGLKDVIVVIEGITSGKPFKPVVADVVSKDCEFFPFVNIVQYHGALRIKNDDPLIHNSQLYQSEKGNVILNVPMPPNSDETYTIAFEKGKRVYQMICGMHEYMQTWGFAVDNPYYARVDDQGRFTIDKIPPGRYHVIAWHPHIQMIEREMMVPANGDINLNFEFDAGKVELPQYERQEKFRVGP